MREILYLFDAVVSLCHDPQKALIAAQVCEHCWVRQQRSSSSDDRGKNFPEVSNDQQDLLEKGG